MPERIVYEDVVTFPAVKQDVAFAVSEDVPAGALVAAVREAAGPLLHEARVFDVYRGEQVGAGRKSVAIHLAFQSSGADAHRRGRRRAARDGSLPQLAKQFDAELRA